MKKVVIVIFILFGALMGAFFGHLTGLHADFNLVLTTIIGALLGALINFGTVYWLGVGLSKNNARFYRGANFDNIYTPPSSSSKESENRSD
ncbi:MAG: hypothetical protein FWD82_02210 [Defluviitaleaceae bacterium]|nr:hypothetical protein [Defluviitaleaceae bacterium]